MKKLAIIAALAVASVAASAADVSFRVSNPSGAESYRIGVAVGKKFGAIGVEGAYDASTVGTVRVDRYSVVGSYDVAKVAGVTISPKVGVAYVHPGVGPTGYVATVGVGASYPLTKNLNLVADYAWQNGQARVNGIDNNVVSAGLKYSF